MKRLVLAAVWVACVGGAAAAELPAADPETYGGTSLTAVNYGALGFTPMGNGQWSFVMNGMAQRASGTDPGTCTNVHLPSGALLEAITTYTNDTDAVGSVAYTLLVADLGAGTSTTPFNFATTGTPGIERVLRPVSPAITVNNDRRSYSLCIFHGAIGGTNQNAGATFWYRLQVSPAPATATFGDVPVGSSIHRFVEALAASGITGGCGGGNYCPDAPLTRGQMAVFLAAALGLHFPN